MGQVLTHTAALADGGEGEQPARHQPPQVQHRRGRGGAAAAGGAGTAGPVQVPQQPPCLQRQGLRSPPPSSGSPTALPRSACCPLGHTARAMSGQALQSCRRCILSTTCGNSYPRLKTLLALCCSQPFGEECCFFSIIFLSGGCEARAHAAGPF